MENLERSWNFKKLLFPVLGNKLNPKSFGKVMEMFYIHMFINAV